MSVFTCLLVLSAAAHILYDGTYNATIICLKSRLSNYLEKEDSLLFTWRRMSRARYVTVDACYVLTCPMPSRAATICFEEDSLSYRL